MDTVALCYSHTQKPLLFLILYGPALACFALGGMVGCAPDSILSAAVGLLFALLEPREISSDLHARSVAEHRTSQRWPCLDRTGRLGATSSW
jgi:hypothetical protein